jgi:glycosyltransferase involved in cell wall biosynthesis
LAYVSAIGRARVRVDHAAGILFLGNVHHGKEAEENVEVVTRLGCHELPVQLEIRDSTDRAWSVDKSVQAALERLTRQRVELARSVLMHSGNAEEWNLDYYGRYRVGRMSFGLRGLHESRVRRCNAMDEVWVPSAFVRDNFVESGVKEARLRVVPTGVDTNVFRPGLPAFKISGRCGFAFLAFTDWEPRRGTDLLLRAYLEEFRRDDDVTLVLALCREGCARRNMEAEIAWFIEDGLKRKLEQTALVLLLDCPASASERARLYASADAFVSAARAPVGGRRVMEAQAAGLPIIATHLSDLMRLDADEAFLVDIEGFVPASCEDESQAGCEWAQPSVGALKSQLRKVFSNHAEAKRRAQRGRSSIIAEHDWDVVIPRWAEAFRELLN